MTFTGPITLNLPSTAKNAAGGAGNALVARAGNVRLAGGGSYFRIEDRAGALQVGATNGVATNAYVDLGGNSNGNPQNYSVLDLNGFNQTLVGISNYVGNGNAATVTNSSSTTPVVLTLVPANPTTNPNQANLVLTSGNNGAGTNAVISDTGSAAPLSIVINGDPAGVQYFILGNGSYSGTTTLTSGTLAVSVLSDGGTNSSIGASPSDAGNLVFNGGTLRYVNIAPNASDAPQTLTNSTTPSTNRNFTINAGKTGTIDVASISTTLTLSGGSAATNGQLIKAGLGTLILSGPNLHTGGTNVTAGTLMVNSPGSLAVGAVNVASGATVGGDGTIGGSVSLASGGTLSPGNLGVGTFTVGGLTLNNGGIVNFEFAGTNDLIAVTNAGGLTLNGGNLNLFNAGTTAAFATNGTYTLFNYSGALSGALSNLTVSNPTAGKLYTLASTATAVQLTIGDATTREWNNSAGTGVWTTGTNWIGGTAPNGVGQSAKFGSSAAGGSVNLSGNKTVSGLIFDNGASYTLTGTSSTLTLDNGVAAAAITVNNGSHTIAVPISLNSASSISFVNPSTGLTISGAISGAKPVTVSGAGALTLTGNNSYGPTALLSGATLNVGTIGGTDTSGSLGTGDVTMSGASTLNFNRTNAYTFGGAITGSGAASGTVNQLGSGTTTVSGAISNVTSVNVSAGTLIASSTLNQTGGVNVTGAGSLTASGAISGAGALTIGTTGNVALNANNTYTGGTSLTGGTVVLNSANALPTNSVLTVDGGGTLDLNAKNISLSSIAGTTTGGIITNNGPAGSTSTINFAGSGASYNMFAAINNGTNGGKVALVTSIANTASGNIFVLHSHAASTYSGGTTVNSQSIQADVSNAFGTGPITVSANNASTNSSQILLAPGVSIPNNITVAQGNPHPVNGTVPEGVIQQTAAGGDTTVSGTITIQSNNVNDGLFNGPIAGGPDFMNVTGAVNVAGTADTIIQIGGNVKYSGGGNYPNLQISGTAALGAANGLSQTSAILMSNASAGTLDLNGFDQTAVSLSATSTTNQSIVQNSGTTTNTMTLNTKGNSTFNGAINGSINLTIAGTGRQILSGFNSYTGNTRINSGTLQLGTDSAISGTSNLILAGGTFATDGHMQTFSTPLSLLANSTIDLGAGASIVQFSDSHTQTWTAGALLRVSNWSGNITGSGTDQLLVGDSTKTGLSATQLSRIHFSGFHTGAAFVVNGASGELVPANTTPLLRGDLNQDNHVNATDVTAMLTALTDINAYKAAHPTLDTFEASDILDVDKDGIVSNADLQGLLTTLKSGGGSVAPVPEPASAELAALGGVAGLLLFRRRNK